MASPQRIDESSHETILQLIKELRDETTLLLRQEVALAKTEIGEKVSRIARNSVYLIVGGLIAYVALIVLAGAAVAGAFMVFLAFNISERTALWLAPLVTAAVLAMLGGILIYKALRTIGREKVVPQQTVESIKDDARWVRQRVGGTTS